MLYSTFSELISQYTTSVDIRDVLWSEIEQQYSYKKRYYHTLKHLETMLHSLSMLRHKLMDWDTVIFSLYYHDIVYDVMKSDNEWQSALWAERKMMELGVEKSKIEKVKGMILATKSHISEGFRDSEYFLDTDLLILGAENELYREYALAIRREFSIYPDFLYNPGRKKVLQHFLDKDFIYKTDDFQSKYEAQARLNIQSEIEDLS